MAGWKPWFWMMVADLEEEETNRGKKINRNDFKRVNNRQYWEEECAHMSDHTFKSHFRMEKSTFSLITNTLKPHLFEDLQHRGGPIPIEKICAISIWKLASGQSYRTVAALFSVGRTTAWRCVHIFCNLVKTNLTPTCIRWPLTLEEWTATKNRFKTKKAQFTDCVGAIDGCHIPIRGPPGDPLNSYINKKGWHSINVMAVCDANKMFMYINAKWPGSVNDKRVLANSHLSMKTDIILFSHLYSTFFLLIKISHFFYFYRHPKC